MYVKTDPPISEFALPNGLSAPARKCDPCAVSGLREPFLTKARMGLRRASVHTLNLAFPSSISGPHPKQPINALRMLKWLM